MTTQPLPLSGGPTSNDKKFLTINFPTIKYPISNYFLPPPPTTIASKYQEEEDGISITIEVWKRDNNRKSSAVARDFAVPY